jgi:hypothetical protein
MLLRLKHRHVACAKLQLKRGLDALASQGRLQYPHPVR